MAFLWLLIEVHVYGQEKVDTVFLEELIVRGVNNEPFAIGHYQTFGVDSISSLSLGDLLSERAGVFLIQYGATGQLASINIRGLGAARSSLLWNGIEINSFALGQTDYSLIQGGLFDQITLKKGSGSSLFGNGALGGTVEIIDQLSFSEEFNLGISHNYNTLRNNGSRICSSWSTDRISLSTRISHQKANNNFEYQWGGERITQQDASYQNYSINQELGIKINKKNFLSGSAWFSINDKEIQQAKGDFSAPDYLADKSLRSSLKWINVATSLITESQLAYTWDWQQFNSDQPQKINRLYSKIEQEIQSTGKFHIKYGLNNNLIFVQDANYANITSENRNDLFFAFSYRLLDQIKLIGNIREPLVNGHFKPISPTAGINWIIFQNLKNTVQLDGQVGRSYRIPTMNDRYWNPGGNPDLLPELSFNTEFGITQKLRSQNNSLTISGRWFLHNVNNWIIWIPGGTGIDNNGNPTSFWYPDNLRHVIAKGVEFDGSYTSMFPNNLILTISGNASYTKSENQIALNRADRSVGKQLPHTPIFQANGNLKTQYNNFILSVHSNHTGKRFTETNNELPPLSAFGVFNVNLGYQLDINELEMVITTGINNLFDKDYEVYDNRAMPGRNYEIQINIFYNKQLNK